MDEEDSEMAMEPSIRINTQTTTAVAIGGVDDGTMEDIADKLKLLDYEIHFCQQRTFRPLHRIYFARPSANPNEQFFYFTSLVAWLIELCGFSFPAPNQFDDPNASATSIISELKRMDMNVKEIAPGKLRIGSGEAVQYVLNILLDRALVSKDWQFKMPEYPVDNYNDEIEDNGTDDLEDIQDDVNSESEGEEEWYGVGRADAVNDKDGDVSQGMIESQVNAEEWRMELERVTPLLKLARRNDHKDWRSHVDYISSLLKTIDKMFPEVKCQLEKMADDIGKAVDKIQKREQSLTLQFETWVEQYRNHKKDFDAVQEKYKSSCEIVNTLSNELNHITEMLESIKTEIAQREEKMTDTSPLVRIKEAMSKIRAEVKQMELRIGVLQHTVLHHKLKQTSSQAAAVLLSGGGAGGEPGVNDSIEEVGHRNGH